MHVSNNVILFIGLLMGLLGIAELYIGLLAGYTLDLAAGVLLIFGGALCIPKFRNWFSETTGFRMDNAFLLRWLVLIFLLGLVLQYASSNLNRPTRRQSAPATQKGGEQAQQFPPPLYRAAGGAHATLAR